MSSAPSGGVWTLTDVHATRQLGALLGRHCPWAEPGARCLFLSGELGSGKTTLAAALLDAIGVHETVRSPSYALIEIYGLGAQLAVHADLYRLRGAAELEQLGLRDYLQPQTLLLIEWPEHGEDALPRPDLWLRLELASDGGGGGGGSASGDGGGSGNGGAGGSARGSAAGGAEGRRCRAQALSRAGRTWLAAVRVELPFSDVV